MNYWIIYDITNDKRRKKISEACKDYGLLRIQKSAFLGSISKNRLEMLMEIAKDAANPETDCIFAIACCSNCYNAKVIVGHFNDDACKVAEHLFID